MLRHCGTSGGRVTSPHSCVIQAFTVSPSNERGEASRGATQHDKVELGSARRKHRSVSCCVIAGTCFHATVLAWRKYARVCRHLFKMTVIFSDVNKNSTGGFPRRANLSGYLLAIYRHSQYRVYISPLTG
jgi:hypothetical protein